MSHLIFSAYLINKNNIIKILLLFVLVLQQQQLLIIIMIIKSDTTKHIITDIYNKYYDLKFTGYVVHINISWSFINIGWLKQIIFQKYYLS